jgi:hypothetical protein
VETRERLNKRRKETAGENETILKKIPNKCPPNLRGSIIKNRKKKKKKGKRRHHDHKQKNASSFAIGLLASL